jgi:hypothetical protein
MQPIKKINILLNLRNYLLTKGETGKQELEKLDWLYTHNLEQFKESIDIKLVINDKMHFCVRLSKKNDTEFNSDGDRLPRHTIDLN